MTGRYITSDPIGLRGGVSTYAYAGANPLNRIDPFGLVDSVVLLNDNSFVCRGGTCTADRFANGSGVTLDENGKMMGVSTSSMNGKSLQELSCTIKNGSYGWTTAGDIRAAGGTVTHSPTSGNPYHTTVEGITSQQAENLFKPNLTSRIKGPTLKILGGLGWLGTFLDLYDLVKAHDEQNMRDEENAKQCRAKPGDVCG